MSDVEQAITRASTTSGTLESYVAALDGTLHVVAVFGDRTLTVE